MLSDRERAAIAQQVEELDRLIDELTAGVRRRLDGVKNAMTKRCS